MLGFLKRVSAEMQATKKFARANAPTTGQTQVIAQTALEQADAAMTSHTRAAERIGAAEYAYNRLLAECSTVMSLPRVPAE